MGCLMKFTPIVIKMKYKGVKILSESTHHLIGFQAMEILFLMNHQITTFKLSQLSNYSPSLNDKKINFQVFKLRINCQSLLTNLKNL